MIKDKKVKTAIDAYGAFAAAIQMLTVLAEESQAPNYVELTFSGVVLPFDRAVITLMRPGGQTPSQLLEVAKKLLAQLVYDPNIRPEDAEAIHTLLSEPK